MRIISKIHDFYDSGVTFGHTDDKYVFNRITKTIKPTNDDKQKLFNLLFGKSDTGDLWQLDSLFDKRYPYGTKVNHYWEIGYLSFCGVIYPYLQFSILFTRDYLKNWNGSDECERIFSTGSKGDGSDNSKLTFFDEESALRFINKLDANNFFKHHLHNQESHKHWTNYVKQYFKVVSPPQPHPFAKQYSVEINSPYFAVCDISISSRFLQTPSIKKVIASPSLKDFQFQKIFDANTALQEISMFVCGILGCDEKEIIKTSDKDIRDSKGFDDKSFKAGKNTKKRKQK